MGTNHAEIKLSRMGRNHVTAIAELEALCFSEPWSRKAVEAELENHQAVVYVAEIDGVLAGYAGLRFVVDEAYVTNIAVYPQYRHKGVGRALIEAQKRLCTRRGFSMLTLEVRESNATAIGLYTQEGFTVEGRRKDFYKAPKEDALIMSCFFSSQPGGGENTQP